ncbi:MAG: hypothetical protein K8F91_07110, partial [Candidatus Obscuribacterales bacterium]|nr:hypothetical protein [Candidatus Obscuribacterales bacterium]
MLFKTIRWWLISAVLVVPLLVHQEAQGTARIAALSASEQPSLSNGATKAQIKLFLDTQRRTVDYSQIWPSDVPVMFLGEWHTSKSHKEELISNLLDWKENHGLTHVAMEMLRSL